MIHNLSFNLSNIFHRPSKSASLATWRTKELWPLLLVLRRVRPHESRLRFGDEILAFFDLIHFRQGHERLGLNKTPLFIVVSGFLGRFTNKLLGFYMFPNVGEHLFNQTLLP